MIKILAAFNDGKVQIFEDDRGKRHIRYLTGSAGNSWAQSRLQMKSLDIKHLARTAAPFAAYQRNWGI